MNAAGTKKAIADLLGIPPTNSALEEGDRVEALVPFLDDELGYVVEWLVDEEGMLRSEALRARSSFLRFVALSHLADRSALTDCPLVPPEDADRFWHAFLLFTASYRRWCERCMPGGRFLNHFPHQGNTAAWRQCQSALSRTFNVLEECCGSSSAFTEDALPDSYANAIWPPTP